MLCMADRGFRGYEHWKAASETGAQLLWRCASNRQLPVVKPLADGSYLSVIYPDVKSRRTRSGEIAVRVIEYSLPGVADAQERYRLLTTLLSPEQAPALELARLYHERWEVEAVFDELKTHLAQRRRTLRSKTPDGVRQEFYGWVLAHYAVCWLMHHAASERRLEQRRLSFTGHVHLLRRAQPRSGAFPPGRPRLRKRWFNDLLHEAATLRCASSRGRANPRMVKRRNSPYASHDPIRLPGTRPETTPHLLKPKPLSPGQRFATFS
ncbi:transposase [Polaromonas sp. P1(28)-8]|nr:transposase [Polaromonas sp. P1(28)-8]UUZ71411.1 transposase [Polaromonas sp. P1(28)-8]